MSGVASNSLPRLPARAPDGHKGTFGTVAVIGGQAGATPMIGGPALAAVSALRAGCGLARLVMPSPIIAAGLVIAPSATGVSLAVDEREEIVAHLAAESFDRLLATSDCIAIGPGLGVSRGAAAISLRAVSQREAPVVVDADALNNLAGAPELQRDFHARAIVTPHPGEFARLARPLGVTADAASEASRVDAAEQLAQRLGCVVVLKGAATVVSDGQRSWTCDVVDAALATAGTGDVLTGVISGIVAQFGASRPGGAALSLFDCARVGVQAHAAAAGIWRERSGASAGMLAMELSACVPAAVEMLREG